MTSGESEGSMLGKPLSAEDIFGTPRVRMQTQYTLWQEPAPARKPRP